MQDYVAQLFVWCLVLNLIPLFGSASASNSAPLDGFQDNVRRCQRRVQAQFKVCNHRWSLTLTLLWFISTPSFSIRLFFKVLKETEGALLHLAATSLLLTLKCYLTRLRGIFGTMIRHPPDFGGTFLTTSEKTLPTRELVVQIKYSTLFSDIIMIHNIHHNIFHSDYRLKDENATQSKLYQFRTPLKDFVASTPTKTL